MNKKKLIKAVLANALVLFVLFLMFHPTEKTDDYIMKLILSGAYSGTPNAHLLYSNYVLGLVLKLLTIIIPFVSWYEMAQYLTIFASLTAFTYVMYDEHHKNQSWLIIIPVLLYFGFEGYIKLTFTKTAGIAAGAGMLLFFMALMQPEVEKKKLLPGLFFVFLGSLFRWKAIICTIVIFVGVILIQFIQKDSSKKTIVLTAAKVFAVAMICIYGFTRISSLLFKIDPGWADYKEYNTYKVELQDYGWPDYWTYQTEYESLGITYNDYIMWKDDRNYSDPARFTNEMLESICDLKADDFSKYFTSFRAFFLKYPQEYLRMNMVFVALPLLFLLLFTDHPQKWHVAAYMFFFSILMDYYLFANGRYGKTHTDVATWFANCMFLCYYLKGSKIKNEYIYPTVLLVFGIFATMIRDDYRYINAGTYTGQENTISHDDARYTIDLMSENKQNLYVLSNQEYYGILRGYKPWERIPAGKYSNVFILSGYMQPTSRSVLDRYYIHNIYKHMTDSNVYFISSQLPNDNSDLQILLTYIREHYDPTVYYEEISNDHGAVTIKFHSAGFYDKDGSIWP